MNGGQEARARPGGPARRIRHQPVVTIRQLTFALALAWVSGCSSAQPAGPPRPMERSEPHEVLAFYEGTWTILDKGGENYRETCAWLPEGRRHMVCSGRDQTPNGPVEALGVYSYDAVSAEYLYHGFKAGGRVSIDRCQRIAKGFRCLKVSGKGVDRVQERFTIAESSDGHVNAVSETAKGDGPWIVDDKTEYLRTRP